MSISRLLILSLLCIYATQITAQTSSKIASAESVLLKKKTRLADLENEYKELLASMKAASGEVDSLASGKAAEKSYNKLNTDFDAAVVNEEKALAADDFEKADRYSEEQASIIAKRTKAEEDYNLYKDFLKRHASQPAGESAEKSPKERELEAGIENAKTSIARLEKKISEMKEEQAKDKAEKKALEDAARAVEEKKSEEDRAKAMEADRDMREQAEREAEIERKKMIRREQQLAREAELATERAEADAKQNARDESIANLDPTTREQYMYHLKEAEGMLRRGQFDDAKIAYFMASELNPIDPYPIEMYSKIEADGEKMKRLAEQKYLSGGKGLLTDETPKAKDVVTSTAKPVTTYKEPENPAYNEFIRKADKFLQADDLESAKINYLQALDLKPSESYPRTKLEKIRNLEASTAVQREYNSIYTKAEQYFYDKDYDNAIDYYNQALGVMPEQTSPREKLKRIEEIDRQYMDEIDQASTYLSNNNYWKAKGHGEKAKALMPNDIRAFEILALIKQAKIESMAVFLAYDEGIDALDMGSFPEAITKLTIAIEGLAVESSKFYYAHYNRGLARYSVKDYQGAIEDYLMFAELNQSKAYEAWYLISFAKIDDGDEVGALEALNKAIELNNRHTYSYFERARIRIKQRNFEAAIVDLKKTVEINSKYCQAYATLAFTERTLMYLDDAMKHIDDAEKCGYDANWVLRERATVRRLKASTPDK